MQVNDFRPHRFLGGRLIRESDLYASIYGNIKLQETLRSTAMDTF